MEKESFFGNHGQWLPATEMNCDFLNPNWEQSMEQGSHFVSALSSMVTSPSNNPSPASTAAADSVLLGKLIGRLGSICNSGEIAPHAHQYLNGVNNNSCYTTPLNSPPKLNLSVQGSLPIPGNLVLTPGNHLVPFSADPGFTERAARFSCFGNYGGYQMGVPEISMQDGSLMETKTKTKFGTIPARPAVVDDEEFGSARDESSASDHMTVGCGKSTRKRKAVQRARAKDVPASPVAKDLPQVAEEDMSTKRTKSSEMEEKNGHDVKPKMEQTNSAKSVEGGEPEKEKSSKPSEPPKQDYIHVRARRGQATDSHSLAERVRREKISERMKFLQDLVPGCNKVTGKAVMLDEIINYVQSLQRQVEFLSMKLATVNPQMDINIENLLHMDAHRSHLAIHAETLAPMFPFVSQSSSLQSIVASGIDSNHCAMNSLVSTLKRSVGMQLPTLKGFAEFASQVGGVWDDDLQNVVQMGFCQNQESVPSSSSLHGALPTAHMKVEL